MDLVVESCSEDPLLWARHGIIYAAGSQFCKGKVVLAQLHGDGRKLNGMGVVDWVSSWIGLITGQFLDLR
jgi:hypothetical protein